MMKTLQFPKEINATAQKVWDTLWNPNTYLKWTSAFNPHKKSLFMPYTMLGYYITSDEDTCNTVYDFFQHQLKNPKLLNTAGTKDKKMFFNRVYQKIDFYKSQMTVFPDML